MFDMRIKAMFFDAKAVTSRVDKATRKVLSKFGAFVRTAARSSIRTRKAVSQPGAPPSSHTGLLKNFIFFGYDPALRSVVIGPAKLNQVTGDVSIPAVLEHGGVSVVADGRRYSRRTRRVRISARPFMGPALEQEKAKLPAMWADSVRQ